MTDLFGLDGRVALVVGAADGGLGAFASRVLADAGATIAVADLEQRADDLGITAAACGPAATQHHVDVTDADSVQALVDAVVDAHGRLDILVACAGAMLRKDLEGTTLPEWQRVIDVNLTGTWLLNRAVAPVMRRQRHGRIVNFSTVYAERVGPIPESAYYAAKAGIANLTRAVASELGKDGVTANCLAPGVFFPTRMTEPLRRDPEQLQWFSDRTLVGRLGDPERDLAGPLLLLASDASSYVTGQILYVDGGWSAW